MSSAASSPAEVAGGARPSLFSLVLTVRRFSTIRRAMWGAAALLGAAWLLVARGPTGAAAVEPAAPAAARALPVLSVSIEPVDGYSVRRAWSGELRPRRAADLAWEAAGRVLAVRVDEGDRVEAGEVLAELERDRAVAELDGSRAQRARELARLDELLAGPRAQTLAAARAEVRALERELELARQRNARRAQLVAGRFVTAEELDETATRADTLAAELEAARQRLDELEEGTRAEDLAQQRAAVAELDARVARLEVELADRELRAPFAGVVTARALDEGAVVEPGRTALRLVEADALEARVGLPVERAAALAIGQRVELEIRGRAVPALVRAVVPELDGATRTSDVVLALAPEDSRRHLPGEVVRLALDERVEARGAWVPTAALVPGTRGLWAAYALVPSEDDPELAVVERIELEVLHSSGDRTLVRGTLGGGERIVSAGVHRVVPGQLVAAVD